MRPTFPSFLATATAVTVFLACSGGGRTGLDDAPSVSPGGICAHDSDCGAGVVCGFKVGDGCQAAGTCVVAAARSASCDAVIPGCGCDGSGVSLLCNGYPDGYAGRPVAHPGACDTDAGGGTNTDAGTGACRSDADCASGQLCGFKSADGCTAAGTCFTASPQAECEPGNRALVTGSSADSYSAFCACAPFSTAAGVQQNLSCNRYPPGTASAPVLHEGPCAAPDAGIDGAVATMPMQSFACGANECMSPSQVCIDTQAPGRLPTYACVSTPSSCPAPLSCSCVEDFLGGHQCSVNNGKLTLTLTQ